MEPSLGLVEAFVRVVERQSFGKAAQELQLTPSAVSRQVKLLEEALGVQLLSRTTRAMSLTETGRAFFAECQAALDQIRHARETARRAMKEPRGTLKISVPIAFGRSYVVPHVAAFLTRFPEIQIELTLTDRFVDVVADGLSMAIRIGRLPDSRLLSRKLLSNHRILVASPAFLATHSPINELDDLKRLDCLALTINRDGEMWRVVGPGGERSIRPQGRARADSGDAIRRLAIDGVGVAFLSKVNVVAAIRSGKLVQILPQWTGRETGVFAVFPPPRPVNPSVDAFVKFLASSWEGDG